MPSVSVFVPTVAISWRVTDSSSTESKTVFVSLILPILRPALIVQTVVCTRRQLDGANLPQECSIAVNFGTGNTGKLLFDTVFSVADLSGAIFSDTDLSGVVFSDAVFSVAIFSDTTFSDAVFSGVVVVVVTVETGLDSGLDCWVGVVGCGGASRGVVCCGVVVLSDSLFFVGVMEVLFGVLLFVVVSCASVKRQKNPKLQ
ncbi:MAG: pentapeptide repeat-containing protein [Planctomycetaceae bacterium]|nr:pentapeptide repeat-containing protein [Planctomycetaceae bacterium]